MPLNVTKGKKKKNTRCVLLLYGIFVELNMNKHIKQRCTLIGRVHTELIM